MTCDCDMLGYPWVPTVPKLYLDAVSIEQQIKQVYCWLNSLSEYVTSDQFDYSAQIDSLKEEFDALAAEYEKFVESGYEDHYEELLTQWVNENFALFVDKFLFGVFFGLTQDGCFCAYIPESWDDIEFYTDPEYASENYGKLQLNYN